MPKLSSNARDWRRHYQRPAAPFMPQLSPQDIFLGTTMTTSKALDNRELIEKALIMLVGFLASGVLGLLRMAVLASQFGTGAARDSFSSAQQIPEIVFVLVAGGALGSSFIPIYARIREADPQDAWRLASAVMTLTATAAAILAAIVYVFAPQIVSGVLSHPAVPSSNSSSRSI